MSTFLRSLKLSLMVACMLLFLSLNAQDCLPGYTYLGAYNGHHYYLSQSKALPATAYTIAESYSAYIASITTAGENAWIAGKVPNYVIIGLSDVDVEGIFEWHSGEPYIFNSWQVGEPNNSGNEDYVVTNFNTAGNGKWNDFPALGYPSYYLIEFEDDDNDGISNVCDNCPDLANADQADGDQDGIGDVCDDCPSDPHNDADGDGICGDVDNCPNSVNEDQDDSDCDGVGDACDLCPGGNDAMDNNHDNIPDCSQLLAYNKYSSAWYCGANKIMVCHNDENPHTICISKNALPDHFSHGDMVGPCTTCGESELRRSKQNSQEKSGEWLDQQIWNDQEFNVSMYLSPNPATDFIEIHFRGLRSLGQLIVVDALGKPVLQRNIEVGQESMYIDLKANGMVKGSYITLLKTDQAIVSSRFMVTN